jgi:glycosyltransferase involved in cell wall biosynthesis
MNSPLKVLHLGSPTGLYGAERWILALIKHLDPVEVESIVGVIKAPSHKAPLLREAGSLGFNTVAFEAPGKMSISAIIKLHKFIKDNRIDIINTHFYKTDFLGLIAALGTGCKVISTPHGWSQEADIKLKFYEFLDRSAFPFMDAVVPLSEEIHRPLTHIPFLKKKLMLIENGVDVSEIDEVDKVDGHIQKWKEQGFFIIGYIGQLISRKNISTLLKALGNNNSFKWRLILVGEGEQRKNLEQLAVDLKIDTNVHFLGYRKDRISLLKGFDVFVLPSFLEGIPRCLMEAMAANIPVIASNIAGCRDLITTGKNGILFEPGDHQVLARNIRMLRSNARLSHDLVGDAREVIEDKFSANRMADEYSILYKKIGK